MFECKTCHRTYATRSTLTRHARNHSQHAGFSCETCNVRFQRRDLLRRHRLIHDGTSPSAASRQRCHTACNNCRTRRTKCDGAEPCAACSSINSVCHYPSTGGRISAQEHTTGFPSVSVAEDVENTVDFERNSNEALEAFGAGNELLDNMEISLADTMAAPTDSFWPFLASWQWTHEDLYLHNNGLLAGSTGVDALQDVFVPDLELADGHNTLGQGNLVLPGREVTHGLSNTVANMVLEASGKDGTADWSKWSLQLSSLIELTPFLNEVDKDQPVIETLVERYFKHFHPLWPLISSNISSAPRLHPLLILTLTSIGALYSGANAAAQYGILTHSALRSALLEYKDRNTQGDNEALDIGRAMLLTQVAALYFEQEGAFSAAEQLGARLSAHAHRMKLFTLNRRSRASQNRTPGEQDIALMEGRRMLAYGMLRAETFMSVLFNRKPMLSYEEIDLPLPFARSTTLEASAALDLANMPGSSNGGLLFSDLVRVALDQAEPLPVLKPIDLELLLFGLQNDVWRFSHDPDMFFRLIRKRAPDSDHSRNGGGADMLSFDLLDHTTRKMQNLVNDYHSLCAALSKCDSAMQQSQLLYSVDHNRSAYLSGMLLLRLSLLRLCAPVDAILQVAYQSGSPPDTASAVYEQVVAWVSTTRASDSIMHAQKIWRLLSAETSRGDAQEAKYNILALIALHIAAAVTWAVAGSNLFSEVSFLEHQPAHELLLQSVNTRSLMVKFADIYPHITRSWGMQSSFARIVLKLAEQPFVYVS